MSNPKFSVGDNVALFRLQPLLAIPCTTISEIIWIRRGDRLIHLDGTKFIYRGTKFAMYAVSGSDQIHGELLLKLIDPHTEYAEDTQDLQSPIESGVGV